MIDRKPEKWGTLLLLLLLLLFLYIYSALDLYRLIDSALTILGSDTSVSWSVHGAQGVPHIVSVRGGGGGGGFQRKNGDWPDYSPGREWRET